MKEIGVTKTITENDIVNLSYQIITNEEKLDISEEIQNILINKLDKEPINYQGDNIFMKNHQLLKIL
jgi:hypothetical protein